MGGSSALAWFRPRLWIGRLLWWLMEGADGSGRALSARLLRAPPRTDAETAAMAEEVAAISRALKGAGEAEFRRRLAARSQASHPRSVH